MRAFQMIGGLLALISAMAVATATLAQGQLSPVITVNDRVITQFELSQRIALLDLFGTAGDLQEQAREGLIEDRLKQQEMDRVGLPLSDTALQTA